jgi:hypothetical protein
VTLRPLGAGAAVLLAVVVSGCGTSLNPGAAAQVNDQRITQSEVDDMVMAACEFSKVARLEAGGKDPQSSMAALRETVIGAKVQFALTEQAAEELGITVSDAAVTAAMQTVPPQLTGDAADLVRDFFHDAAKAQVQQAVIGAHSVDSSVTDDSAPMSDENLAAGEQFLQEYAAEQDIEVNPEFGTWDGSKVSRGSGSLSVAVSDRAEEIGQAADNRSIPDLPASQVCG